MNVTSGNTSNLFDHLKRMHKNDDDGLKGSPQRKYQRFYLIHYHMIECPNVSRNLLAIDVQHFYIAENRRFYDLLNVMDQNIVYRPEVNQPIF